MSDSIDTSVTERLEPQPDEREESRRRRRWPLLLLLLLLLLLCSVATFIETWIEYGPEERSFIVRNLECLQCHTELIPDMRKPSVHNPFLMKECTICHTPHGHEVTERKRKGGTKIWQRISTLVEWWPLKLLMGAWESPAARAGGSQAGATASSGTGQTKGAESVLTAPENELCWICHGDLSAQLGMPFQHNPFEMGACTTCHNPHASDFRVLLAQDERDLCVTCHPVADEMSRAQVHPPFEGRFCTNCHHPHASDYRGVLVTNQRNLCFTCHPSVAPLSLKAVQHQPFLGDNCTGCHEPHGANVRPLLVAEQPKLCYNCHPDIRYDFLKASYHPVGIKLVCSDCHQPHAADWDALVIARDNLLCYECHGLAIRTTYDKSAHKNTLCIRCHTPHGSAYTPLLQQRNPDLCLRCHPPYEGPNKHPVRPVRVQRYNEESGVLISTREGNEGLTCTSDCHKPHGTMYPRMLTWAYRVDGLCLSCHPAVGKDF